MVGQLAFVCPSEGKIMKGLLRVTLLAIVAVNIAQAQDTHTFPSQSNVDVGADFANTAAAATASVGFSDAPLWLSREND